MYGKTVSINIWQGVIILPVIYMFVGQHQSGCQWATVHISYFWTGPPGTGKTYVGLKIVQALLYNLYEVPCAGENDDEDDENQKSGENSRK